MTHFSIRAYNVITKKVSCLFLHLPRYEKIICRIILFANAISVKTRNSIYLKKRLVVSVNSKLHSFKMVKNLMTILTCSPTAFTCPGSYLKRNGQIKRQVGLPMTQFPTTFTQHTTK